MSSLFGGGVSEARKSADESRQQQRVANERQSAALSSEGDRTRLTRRNPRGRRLFVSDIAQKGTLS